MWSEKELIDKQARFWVLMGGGSTLTAACEAVGVSRATWPSLATGNRWSDPAETASTVGPMPGTGTGRAGGSAAAAGAYNA
jgi:hypothetical protein